MLFILCNDIGLVSLLFQGLAQFYYCVHTLYGILSLYLPSLYLHFLIQKIFSLLVYSLFLFTLFFCYCICNNVQSSKFMCLDPEGIHNGFVNTTYNKQLKKSHIKTLDRAIEVQLWETIMSAIQTRGATHPTVVDLYSTSCHVLASSRTVHTTHITKKRNSSLSALCTKGATYPTMVDWYSNRPAATYAHLAEHMRLISLSQFRTKCKFFLSSIATR